MTKEQCDPRADEDVHRIVRVAALHDPLGAKGFRQTRARIQREAVARRGLFLAIVAAFAVSLGLVTAGSGQSGADQSASGVVAEKSGTSPESSRVTKPPKPHVRTRSS